MSPPASIFLSPRSRGLVLLDNVLHIQSNHIGHLLPIFAVSVTVVVVHALALSGGGQQCFLAIGVYRDFLHLGSMILAVRVADDGIGGHQGLVQMEIWYGQDGNLILQQLLEAHTIQIDNWTTAAVAAAATITVSPALVDRLLSGIDR